jgi:flagellar hook assembly protein FlgD
LGSYPNPFNPATTIRFQLATAARVELTVFDVRGAIVSRLLQGERSAGQHAVIWDGLDDSGRPAASGVYLARLRVRERGGWRQSFTQRMTLIR